MISNYTHDMNLSSVVDGVRHVCIIKVSATQVHAAVDLLGRWFMEGYVSNPTLCVAAEFLCAINPNQYRRYVLQRYPEAMK